MIKKDCAARRRTQEAKEACRSYAIQGSSLLANHHQNIGGVLVAAPVAGQAFSSLDTPGSAAGKAFPFNDSTGQGFSPNDASHPQILQKYALATPDPSAGRAISFTQDVEQNDQSVGLSTTNTRAPQNTHMMSQTSRPEDAAHKMRFSQSGLLYTLHMIRQPVVEYQETRGVPRNEEITFLTLVTSLCTQAYTAAITILVMLWNLMPLVDGLVYFVRFMLDKAIDIVQTEDNKERAIKAAILFGEMTIITFIIFMIVGLIFMPVYVLMARLFGKIFSMIAW